MPDQAELQLMRWGDLRKLASKHGMKASRVKKPILIENLLKAFAALPPTLPPPPAAHAAGVAAAAHWDEAIEKGLSELPPEHFPTLVSAGATQRQYANYCNLYLTNQACLTALEGVLTQFESHSQVVSSCTIPECVPPINCVLTAYSAASADPSVEPEIQPLRSQPSVQYFFRNSKSFLGALQELTNPSDLQCLAPLKAVEEGTRLCLIVISYGNAALYLLIHV
eukprot:m.377144 g.377144  ORF g.377144 m.377144 type:complete len:224 (+) comp16705_c4_seq7:283-954(+)